jgi:tRNA dimethylallyltransferase
MKQKVAAIVGPTAVGKTEVAVEVAEKLGAEIVSIDSMQIYKGMDIGTAKPSPEQRASVRHHLIDVLEPSHPLTVSEFQSLARTAIEEAAERGALPLLVGGSGLYFRAVVDDLRFPPRAGAVRRGFEDEADRLGPEALHARLAEVDPVAASRIEPGNARRTVRALEVIEITGSKFSDNSEWERYESYYELAIAGLRWPRNELYARIESRVARMLRDGLVEESRRLERAGLGTTARQALGYRQVLESASSTPAEDLRDEIVRATKRFARRQESWFKTDPRLLWFEAAKPDLARELAAFFESRLNLAAGLR